MTNNRKEALENMEAAASEMDVDLDELKIDEEKLIQLYQMVNSDEQFRKGLEKALENLGDI